MNILNIRDNCLVITVSKNDLDIFELTYETLDYSSVKTKALIRLALDKTAELTGAKSYDGKGMLIEALPDTDGGCLLFFTFTEHNEKKQLKISDEITLIAESPDIELICRLANAVDKMNAAAYSSLYSRDGKYRLIITVPSDYAKGADMTVGEFAVSVPEAEKARTREYWAELIPDSAINILSSLSV